MANEFLQRALELRALVTAVGVELEKERIEAEQSRHEQRAAVAILNVGGVHDDAEQQALRIHGNVALAPLQPFGRIPATRSPFSVVFTLCVSMIAGRPISKFLITY